VIGLAGKQARQAH